MKERPIIFTADSVRAILEGRKSQTRRVIKPQPHSVDVLENYDDLRSTPLDGWMAFRDDDMEIINCPYGIPGDRLWVRETWMKWLGRIHYRASEPVVMDSGYAADNTYHSIILPWSPSRYMPRKYSRINLEVASIRVERVQEMTHHDLEAEGMQGELGAAMEQYIKLWDTLNAKRGYPWTDNPWVWVIEFKVLP